MLEEKFDDIKYMYIVKGHHYMSESTDHVIFKSSRECLDTCSYTLFYENKYTTPEKKEMLEIIR